MLIELLLVLLIRFCNSPSVYYESLPVDIERLGR
jgi:hypothetical protein